MKTIKPIAISIALINAGIALPSFAQQQDNTLEEVIVTGIRASLERSVDIKRDEAGVVDAISAEDMGKFPDTNLAESLQRITGVSIDRKNNEGNQVSVRGFGPSFNMVTLNGRQMPAASTAKQEGDSTGATSRAFNFSELTAESVAGVNVYKTSRADMATGGIGATIDIKSAKPLEVGDTLLAGTVKAVMDQSNVTGSNVTPEVSGIFSTTFADEKIGFLVNASYSARDSREDKVATDGWMRVAGNNMDVSAVTSEHGQVWLPRNIVVEQADHERVRTNAQAVFQYAPTDALRFTLDYTMSQYEDTIERSQVGVWIEERNVGDTLLTGVADTNGSITDISITHNFESNYGAVDWQGYSDLEKSENESIGFNVEWDVTDNLSLEFDYHDSSAEAQPGDAVSDFVVILSGPLGVDLDIDFDGGVPRVALDDSGVAPGYDANTPYTVTGYLDPTGVRPNIDLARNKGGLNEVQQAQFNGAWTDDDSALSAIRFGASSTEYSIDTRWMFDLGVQGQPVCVQTPEDGFNPCPGLDAMLTEESTAFPSVFPSMLTFNAGDVYDQYVGGMQSVFDLAFNNVNNITEKTNAFYVQFEAGTDFNGMPVNMLAGVRYEHTNVTGTTIQNSPEAMVFVSPTEFRPRMTTDAVEYSLESEYDVWLPSFDTNIEVVDDVILRLSYGRSLSRSDLNSMKPALTIGDARPGGPYNANQGNPGLLPYISDNFDFSAEYYYGEGSYVSASYFKKFVDNYVVTGIDQAPIMGALGYNLTDPNPQDDPLFTPDTAGGPDDQEIIWDITSFTNGEAAEVSGLELAVQHFFGETGFGMQANVTFVEGDVEYDSTSLDQSIALTGLSDSANLVGFYEKDGVQVRLAYNWRDEFLLSANQLRQTNEPVFVSEYGQWDISASYEINDNFSVFVDGLNITGESAEGRGRFDEQFIYFVDQSPRYNLGVRFTY
ncbi:TonB-dependent receptor [Saccharophagus degradans]|uniref:TonB-dependent receptor n=1 Tax=Saccharophagus degradans TaxID=86304 RepID=UPI001C083AB6|nr:TonB-dependent receptor [Saccharophagus degradans]MBU2987679.1 TonB-dependent receptor [Saccharophagus degradans]